MIYSNDNPIGLTGPVGIPVSCLRYVSAIDVNLVVLLKVAIITFVVLLLAPAGQYG